MFNSVKMCHVLQQIFVDLNPVLPFESFISFYHRTEIDNCLEITTLIFMQFLSEFKLVHIEQK